MDGISCYYEHIYNLLLFCIDVNWADNMLWVAKILKYRQFRFTHISLLVSLASFYSINWKFKFLKLCHSMQDLVPCILVTFEKEQIVVWRGKDYKPKEDGFFLPDREMFDDRNDSLVSYPEENETWGEIEFCSGEE